MAEQKHTSGPWRWGPDWNKVAKAENENLDEDEFAVPKYADLGLYGKDGETILPIGVDHYQIMYDGYANELSEADRRLIEASPDMYEACKEALRMYRAVHPAGGWQGVEDMLVAALARVEGEGDTATCSNCKGTGRDLVPYGGRCEECTPD